MFSGRNIDDEGLGEREETGGEERETNDRVE